MDEYVLSCVKGSSNSSLMADVAKLYINDGDRVCDVTFGKGSFWSKVDVSRFEFLPTDIESGVDCRDLPYKDKSVNVVVLDPPYIYNPKSTVKDSISNTYNVNKSEGFESTSDVVAFYADAMVEARRVLAPKGVMVVKCQDNIESGKQRMNHIEIHNIAMAMGMKVEDLFVFMQSTVPAIRWKTQKHARKNHSYLWVFRR